MDIQERKLFQLLASLDKKDRNRFIRELDKLHGDKHPEYGKLLRMNIEDKSPEQIWRKLFKGQKYDGPKFRKLLNDLTVKLEDFFAFNTIAKQEVIRGELILQGLLKPGSPDLFISYYERHLKILVKHKNQLGEQYYLKRYLAGLLLHKYALMNGMHTINLGGLWDDLEQKEVYNSLDIWFMHEKLLMVLVAANHADMGNQYLDIPSVDSLRKEMEAKPHLNDVQTLRVLYSACLLQRASTGKEGFASKQVFELEREFWECEPFLARDVANSIFTIILNCIVRLRAQTGHKYYTRKVFELLLVGLEKEFILQNGALSWVAFGNIVQAALEVGEFAKVLAFIHEKKSLLLEETKEQSVNYALGLYHRHKGDYKTARKYFVLPFTRNIFYILGAVMEGMAMDFEEREVDLIESSKKFKARFNYGRKEFEILGERKHLYLIWQEIFHQLVNVQKSVAYKPMLSKLLALGTRINDTPNLRRADWFEEQVAHLVLENWLKFREQSLDEELFVFVIECALRLRRTRDARRLLEGNAVSLKSDLDEDVWNYAWACLLSVEKEVLPIKIETRVDLATYKLESYRLKAAIKRLERIFLRGQLEASGLGESIEERFGSDFSEEALGREKKLLVIYRVVLNRLVNAKSHKELDELSQFVVEHLNREEAAWLLQVIDDKLRNLPTAVRSK